MVCNGIMDAARPSVCHACTGLASDTQTEICLASQDWSNQDIKEDNQSQAKNTKDSDGSSDSVSVGHLLLYLLIILLAMAVGGYFYYIHLQKKMREELRSVLAEYVPLEGEGEDRPPAEGIDMTVMA